MNWLVVRTKARQEQRAIRHLEEQDFATYCPEIPRYNGIKEVVGKQILFPGYCFVRFVDRSVSSIRSTPGVLDLISFGGNGRLSLLGEAEVQDIRAVEAFHNQKSSGLQSGDLVSLIKGPFKGLQGLYSKKSQERVEVLLVLLGRQQRVLVPSNHVLQAEAD